MKWQPLDCASCTVNEGGIECANPSFGPQVLTWLNWITHRCGWWQSSCECCGHASVELVLHIYPGERALAHPWL